jgi:integrase/recombinase XerC
VTPGPTDSDDSAACGPPRAETPSWFGDFLASRGSGKRSPHTLIAWRQDFVAIAALITDGHPDTLTPADITRRSLQKAFATYAGPRAHSTVQRCWATWNAVCVYLQLEELLPDNPMVYVERPKVNKDTKPKSLDTPTVQALLGAVTSPPKHRRTDWDERDLAIILTGLLTGLRSAELCGADVGDLWQLDDGGGAIRVRHGKGNKERVVPIEAALLGVIDTYLDSRAARFPLPRQRGRGLQAWPKTAPLFVGSDGQRLTRGVLQSRLRRAFRLTGQPGRREPGALAHALRHTFATELAKADVNVYTLMNLLGHKSMATSQRYVDAAGTETRTAAASNPLYALLDPESK